MRILYLAGIDPSLPQGHAVHVRRLTSALEGRGHAVRILCLALSRDIPWDRPGAGLRPVRRIRVPKLRHLLSEIGLARLAREEARSFQPDLLLVRQELFTLAPLLYNFPGPLVVETNSSLPAVVLSGGGGAVRARMARALEGRLLRRADVVGAVTERLARIQIAAYGLDPRRVGVAPNGAWLPPPLGSRAAALRDQHGVGEGEFLLGFVGSLSRVQGLETVIRAIRHRSDLPLRFWIVGEGPERVRLQTLVAREGLSGRIDFLGAMPEEEAARHAQAAQVLVAPYRVAEYAALGGDAGALKVLQGLACGRPLLASRVRGLEFLEATGCGRVLDPCDPVAWGLELELQVDAWMRQGRPQSGWPWKEGEEPGRRFIASGHTWDHSAAAWESLLARALEGRIWAER